MSDQISFDQLDDEQNEQNVNSKPLWTIELDDERNEDRIRKWLLEELGDLSEVDSYRKDEMKKNIGWYLNDAGLIDSKVQFSKATQLSSGDRKRLFKKMRVNHIYDLVEQSAARLVRFKPTVSIIPTHDEFKDKSAAKVASKYWDHIKEVQRFDEKNLDVVRKSFIGGEAWLAIEWDEDAGAEHPTSAQKRTSGQESITLLDENGEPRKDEQGNTIKIDLPIYIGDVRYKVLAPWSVFQQHKQDHNDVDYIMHYELVDAEELRLEYPKKAAKIKEGGEKSYFDYSSGRELKLKNKTVLWTFWHRKTKQVPHGRQIKFTKDTILSNERLKYDHGKIPAVRLPNIINPTDRYGISFLRNARQLASRINDLTTMIMRNQALTTHPKWFVPQGSVKIESLGNEQSIVQYRGSQPPVLGQQNPTPKEVFDFRAVLKEDMQQVSGVFGVSRGEPPKGIEAGIALQFLEEQENQRQNAIIVQYNEYIRKIADMTLSTAAQFYEKSDKRTIMVIGENDEWLIEDLDPASLATAFSVRIQNSSSLPESKAGRLSAILQLAKTFPDAIPQEQILDMLDIANSQKFYDTAGAAVKKAQKEDEDMLSFGEDSDPKEWEFHVEHWGVHATTMQSPKFENSPEENKQLLIDHIRAHEMFMVEKASLNPAFQERLLALKQFPLVFTPPQPEIPVESNDKASLQTSPETSGISADGGLLPDINQSQDEAALQATPVSGSPEASLAAGDITELQ